MCRHVIGHVSIPKSSVHCQVHRAEAQLLEHLYVEVNALGEDVLESMSYENDTLTQTRARLKHQKTDLQVMGPWCASPLFFPFPSPFRPLSVPFPFLSFPFLFLHFLSSAFIC